MANPYTTYQITVTYSLFNEEQTYIGWFRGQTSNEAVQAARDFVTLYIRPSHIDAASEVVVLSGL